MPDDPARIFAEEPWNDLPPEAISEAACRVPTMLTPEEQALYFWLGAEWMSGAGVAVDLGCFAGGSTARLADGLRHAGRNAEIHAFDHFTASEPVKRKMLYRHGIPRFDGNDIFPLAQRLLADWAPLIRLHRGDIMRTPWPGTPIEVLLMDASKTAISADAMAQAFFPALIPGRSIVVQQDFLHWRQPWLPAQMELLADFFMPLAFCPWDSVVFLCTRTPDAAALEAARTAPLSDARLKALLRAARSRHAGWPRVKARLRNQIEGLQMNPGARVAARFVRKPGAAAARPGGAADPDGARSAT